MTGYFYCINNRCMTDNNGTIYVCVLMLVFRVFFYRIIKCKFTLKGLLLYNVFLIFYVR